MSDVTSTPARASDRSAAQQTRLAAAVIVARLRSGHATVLRVHGLSMYPFLVPGQSILVEPCGARSLHRGDLVAFERSGRVVLHRVLSVPGVDGRLTEKGDNARRAEVVDAVHVIGRAVAVLSPRRIPLTQHRFAAVADGLARLSAVHACLHQPRFRRSIFGRLLGFASTLLLYFTAALARPPR